MAVPWGPALIVLAVVAAVVALVLYTNRRHWNAHGEDDARRPADSEE